ncbi:P-loop containing nucleoside triphosphate hydrolase protein [Microdochium bolleyi]|uniref:p-loop containing nucleoside triphosphate hydrolase protein n=1 Tax=Microdochium bolleyi TaxID=196109 RepID=A0A136IKU8_9PEZI|nr:P-loop containing nucleoside triphosphate hydrolase protein [Microdochium bolleyi]
MATAGASTEVHRTTPAEIPTEDHRNLLDIIDTLRAQGLSHYVDLPEIIVCGDQSAGKSSVLEAISGLRFPTRDGLCTRFATELVLRRGLQVETKVSIIPGDDRYGSQRDDLLEWQPRASVETEGLEAVTLEALEAMSIPQDQKFFKDILRIDLTGPDQPHLTMVDLPGLFRTGNKEQSDSDAETVCAMVKAYMARPRSIILAVVSAKNEYVLQEVTSMARRADPEGLRTMGLITKPDTLDRGSESEDRWVRLAQNTEVGLRLGWHVLRNRNFEERGSSSAERDAAENDFFSRGVWKGVNPVHCGVGALRTRLSFLLKNQIVSQLPSLVQDVESGIADCTARLLKLGPVRTTAAQQLRYLLRVSEDYTSLVGQSVNGVYTHSFFGNREKHDGYSKRLRAVVQNRLHDFATEMVLDGQTQRIIDSDTEGEDKTTISDSPIIPRSEFIQDVALRMKFNRGRELPGLFNPLIVGDLFIEQCKPWSRLVDQLVSDVLTATHEMTRLVIEHVAADDVFDGVLKFVRERIEGLEEIMSVKVDELLASAVQNSITYNRQLTDNVQRSQQARHKRAIKQQISKIFGLQHSENQDKRFPGNPLVLVDLLAQGLEPDMELVGSSTAVDYMEAYYPVAMNRFIDDVSVIAIEDCLIKKLPGLFKSQEILDMGEETISSLAGETKESTVERQRLEEKHKILENGLRGLRGLLQQGQVTRHDEHDRPSSTTRRNRLGRMTPSSFKASLPGSDSSSVNEDFDRSDSLSFSFEGAYGCTLSGGTSD